MRILILILLLVSPIFLFSQKDKDKSDFWEDVSWSVDFLTFGRNAKFAEESKTVNPDNRVAKLDEFDMGLFIRPDFKYSHEKFSIWLKPRLNFDYNKTIDSHVDLYLQEFRMKYFINDYLYLNYGRYIKSIGTSIFINPSNPFFLESGRLNPKIELRPMDFVEFNYTKNNFEFTLIGNLYQGESPLFNEPFFEFKRNYSLSSEYYGNSELGGAILSISEDERYHFGFYGQKNLNEAMVVWLDGAFNYNPNRFYPVYGHSTSLLLHEMVNEEMNKDIFYSGLVGASYTFNFGPTLYLEFMHNGKGYNSKESDLYYELVESASEYTFDVTKDLAERNLGRSINSGLPYIRKNYIFAQLGENDIFGQLNYNLRYVYSFDDRSSQISSLIEWYPLDNLEIFSVALVGLGKRKSDFGRLIDHQIMFGLIYKI